MAKKAKPASANTDRLPASEYTVVARRYRPQQFAELIGQESVARALTNAIQSGRVAHAYLFTGVRGVGKTSAARILAKALNCVQGPTPTPCDQCDICKAIAEGQDVDVQEIDGASNRGIEDARAIRGNVASRPQRARYKIYIIDEVHMLTREAFNALLKTLEEPPPHVKFIFATTEVNKVPVTILSRCQRFDFGGINPARILAQLKQVVEREGLQADDDALRIVARRAGGSMRDAQSLLEQLLSFGEERLTAQAVHAILGTAADERVSEIAAAILAKDVGRALDLVAKCAEEGLQVGELLDQLIEFWRGLMLFRCSQGEIDRLGLGELQRESVRQQTSQINLDTVLAGIDVLASTRSRIGYSSHAIVLLEIAVIRLSRMDELIPIAELSQRLSQPGTVGLQAPGQTLTGFAAPAADPSKKNGLTRAPEGGLASRNGPLPVPEPSPAASTPLLATNLADVWSKVKQSAGMMLSGQLEKAGLPAIVGPKALVLRFPGEYNHAYDYCRDPRQASIAERLLQEQTGEPWAVRFEILSSVSTAGPAETGLSGRERERMALSMPLLGRIVDQLEGRLLKLDDRFGDNSPEDDAANDSE